MPGTPPPERLIITDRTATDISLFCSIYMLLLHSVDDDADIIEREFAFYQIPEYIRQSCLHPMWHIPSVANLSPKRLFQNWETTASLKVFAVFKSSESEYCIRACTFDQKLQGSSCQSIYLEQGISSRKYLSNALLTLCRIVAVEGPISQKVSEAIDAKFNLIQNKI